MSETKRGGKREGSGRKATGEKKIPVTLYVESKAIWPFVTKDKFRDHVYSLISGKMEVAATIQDLNKPTHQIKPFDQPKTNYTATVQPLPVNPAMGKFEGYRQRILKTTTIKEVEAVMREVKNDLLTVGEKKSLEAIAKQHSTTMYTD